MRANLRYQAIKNRRHNSHKFEGEDKFTGTVSYSVVGTVGEQYVRLSLGTEEKHAAIRRATKLETACAEGPESPLWRELSDSLPRKTFKWFADHIGFLPQHKATAKPTWADLCEVFEFEMERQIANKLRGAGPEEGTMSDSTRERYRQTVRHFTAFLEDKNTLLESIGTSTIEKFKVDRHKKITAMKQSRGGSSIALDIAVLHRMFNLAVSKQMILKKPIDLSKESKPGKNPKNGARPFTGDELKKLRDHAGEDLFLLLLLRWTGLRKSDAMSLRWSEVHFDRGVNGEIEKMTQKRGKLAIIPLSTELRTQLEQQHRARKPRQDDPVLLNAKDNRPFPDGARLYERIKAIGVRAGVRRVTPHCFRDTFACDMLARGTGIFDVAKMLADSVDTVEKHYAQFVPAARDAVQVRMDSGIGIEEQAALAEQRGSKVIRMRG